MKKRALLWIRVAVERFTETEVAPNSVIIAYYLLLSLFPLAIVVGNILPFFDIHPETVLAYINIVVPDSVEEILNPIITGLLTNSSSGLLSFGAIVLIWSAGRGFSYLQRGMNRAYGIKKKGNYIIKRVFSLIMVLLALVVLIAFILIFTIGDWLLMALGEHFNWALLVNEYMKDIKWPASLLIMFVLLLLVYRVMPDVKISIWDALPGTLLSLAGLLAVAQLFTVYVKFSTSLKAYGPLVSVFVLMFWLVVTAVILLLGAVLNATNAEIKYGPARQYHNRVDAFFNRGIEAVEDVVTSKLELERREQENADEEKE